MAADTCWNVQFLCDRYLEVSMYDKKLFDGKQVFRTVKVSDDLTWEATYAGCKTNCSSLIAPLPNEIGSLSEFLKILQVVEVWKTCTGATNSAFSVLKSIVHNVCGEQIGTIEQVVHLDEHGNEQQFSNWRSVSCSYFMETTTTSSALCHSCNILRRNLSVQLVRFNNNLHDECEKLVEPSTSRTNKRFLSEEEMSAKECDQKRRRIAAEKRARYWRFKAAEEKKMKHLASEDDCDLTTMFRELDKPEKEFFPDDPRLSLFWEVQRDVISKKAKQGSIRWHPA